ncbi:MAG TPA: vitamin K epoxide reductase family protein [Thermoplasmata archaeon]|nr:vitamin K epoxide reductase family protein [Thermoplasmata archaeon]
MQIRSLRSAIYLASGVGLLVAMFAAAEFFDASLEAVCSINSFFSCSLVDRSGLTTTFGIQDYLWGIGGFVLILVFAGIAEKRPRETAWPCALLLITTVGVVLSMYFLYVELAEIHALCPVCVTAYLFGGFAWIGAIALVRKTREPARGVSDNSDEPPTAEPT